MEPEINPCSEEDVNAPVVHIATGAAQEQQGMSEDSLNKFYSDLYNFQMCSYCKMPTSDTCCSEACYDLFLKENGI